MDLKEFDQFLKICRKRGVISVTTPAGIIVHFGDLPKKEDVEDEIKNEGGPTDEELMFYATRPIGNGASI